jgi:hypothetical protein
MSCHSPGETKENYGRLRIADTLAEIRTGCLSNTGIEPELCTQSFIKFSNKDYFEDYLNTSLSKWRINLDSFLTLALDTFLPQQ